MDLSYPTGRYVNDMISKTEYCGDFTRMFNDKVMFCYRFRLYFENFREETHLTEQNSDLPRDGKVKG